MVRKDEPGTRERILVAAATMVTEDPPARLSVRAVAGRAGVSAGSLRHFFPTQQALIDEVAAGITGLFASEDVIGDTSIPARNRLYACVQHVLGATGTGEQARRVWERTFATHTKAESGADGRDTYLAFRSAGLRRIEHWLRVLDAEGARAPGRVEDQAAYLNAVIDGLAVARALPTDAAQIRDERTILRYAISTLVPEPQPHVSAGRP